MDSDRDTAVVSTLCAHCSQPKEAHITIESVSPFEAPVLLCPTVVYRPIGRDDA